MITIEPIYVTFEQAKWLKKKRFAEECSAGYTLKTVGRYFWQRTGGLIVYNEHLNEVGSSNHNVKEEFIVSAPEQWMVIKWLWVNHKIWIEIRKVEAFNETKFQAYVNDRPLTGSMGGYNSHNSPEEAYSAAFDYIKNNILI